MEKSFYIPINSSSLAHFFNKAIILPAKYFLRKPQDIQNFVENFILISNSKWVKNSDCTLEIILTDNEIKELIRASEHFYFYSLPIPISRIKSIWFLDPSQKETTIWNINNGTAFVPEHIVFVEKDINIKLVSDKELFQNMYDFKSVNDLTEKIKRYDIILGGLAFMKLGNEPYMSYSTNYFSTLSYFNKLIQEQTYKAIREKGLKITDKFIGLFSKHDSEWSKWQHYIYQNLTQNDIEELAAKEGIKVETKLGLIKIDAINPGSHLYTLAILATYGDGKKKSTEDLVNELINGKINLQKTEEVSILFGLNNGYSKLRNKYKSSLKNINVKFALRSKLDYYIIESIYQFIFHGNRDNYKFTYLDSWCPVNKLKDYINGQDAYRILDVDVVIPKKQSSVQHFLEAYSSKIYSTIHKSLKQWLPPFVKSDEKEAIMYFEKQLQMSLPSSVEELQRIIELENVAIQNTQKAELVGLYKSEINDLKLEILNLKEEINKLKDDSKSEAKVQFIDSSVKVYKVNAETDPHNNINLFRDVTYSEFEGTNFELLSLAELQKIAKTKKIKGISKIKREDLIRQIKS